MTIQSDAVWLRQAALSQTSAAQCERIFDERRTGVQWVGQACGTLFAGVQVSATCGSGVIVFCKGKLKELKEIVWFGLFLAAQRHTRIGAPARPPVTFVTLALAQTQFSVFGFRAGCLR